MKKTYYINGMHCISCEMIIEKDLEKIEGLKVLSLTHKTGKIELEYDEENVINKVKQILKKNKYSLEEEYKKENQKDNSTKNTFIDYIIIILLFIIFGLLYFLFGKSELLRIFSGSGEETSYLSAFLIGIGASLSTCLALLGGIVVGFSDDESGSKKSLGENLKIQFSFHFGRIISFLILGGLLGQIGSLFILSGKVNGFVTIFISILILYIGLHMLNILPSLSKLGLHLPKSITKKLDHNSSMGPFLIGIFTFFIPCGFTQAMQISSVASGSFIKGSLIMGFFALGTMPVLLGLGLMTSYSANKNHSILKKVIGVLIIVFSILGIVNSSNLIGLGSSKNTIFQTESTETNIQISNEKIEEISVSHNGYGVDPSEIKIKSNTKYKLNILPTSNGLGCFTTITIPGVDESIKKIIKGENIEFNIPALSPGKYKFVCTAMGMNQGILLVE